MSETAPNTQVTESADGHNYWQVSLVCLLALSLIAGAFISPPITEFEPSMSVTDSPCEIQADGDLIPGTSVRIVIVGPPEPGVETPLEPLSDVPVWISGERVGTTNATGAVEVTVPYTASIRVQADLREHPECEPIEQSVSTR